MKKILVMFLFIGSSVFGQNTFTQQDAEDYFKQLCLPQEADCSFRQTWNTVVETEQLDNSFKNRSGLDLTELKGLLADFIAGSDDNDSPEYYEKNGFADRSYRTHLDKFNVRKKGVKWLHPMGVCAPVVWEMDSSKTDWNNHEQIPTGLFKDGTKVNGIMRLSAGTTSVEMGSSRLFGFALKLFPAPLDNKDAKVETVNIFTLDNYGFSGSKRKSFFIENNKKIVPFSNAFKITGIMKTLMTKFFSRFDHPGWEKPVYPVASIDGQGQKIKKPISPKHIEFKANFKVDDVKVTDFRDELMSAGTNISFDILLVTDKKTYKLGSVKVIDEKSFPAGSKKKSIVASEACDMKLHFHHHVTQKRDPKNHKFSKAGELEYQGVLIQDEKNWK